MSNKGANREGERFTQEPIEDWVGNHRLVTFVDRARVTKRMLDALTLTTPYKNWELRDSALVAEYGDFVFGAIRNQAGPGDTMTFVWNPNIVFDANSNPVPDPSKHWETLLKEKWISEMIDWPPILTDLQVIIDQIKAGAGDINNLPVDRGGWRDGLREESDVLERIYVSCTPPPRSKIRKNPPRPNSIRGDYYGVPIRIPACLHPLVVMESINSDAAVIYDCTPTRPNVNQRARQTLRPTNHTKWVKHVFSNTVTEREGLFFRRELTAFPPPMNPITAA